MKKSALCILISLSVLFLTDCKPSRSLATRGSSPALQAHITKEGLFDCFEADLTAAGQPVWCEASAVLFDGTNVIMANDKDMPDQRSSVFYWSARKGVPDEGKTPSYLMNPVFKTAKKFEDFAFTPDNRIVFLSTGFDRIKPGSSDWNAYNTIFYWQAGNEKDPRVLSANHTDSTSVFLRDKMAKVLANTAFPAGMPYFKIEGLAATEDKLFFGIREEGKKFDDFTYKVKVVSVSFHVANGAIELGDDYKTVLDFNPAASQPAITEHVGLSSIEYDRFHDRFLVLTSYENGEKVGAYLWSATPGELEKNQLQPVKDKAGKQVSFNHKAEDIAIISASKILVIHDDDRLKLPVNGQTRQPNQAAYSVVEFD